VRAAAAWSSSSFALRGMSSRLACALLLAVAACSTTTKPTPAPLEDFKPQIAGRVVWSSKLEGVAFPLYIAVEGNAFTLAGNEGHVVSLAADDGHELWHAELGAKVAAGVGSDGRYAALVTRDNELIVLDAGKPLWHTTLASKVETAPFVSGERVFVMGVDRIVLAFDALDGRKLWTLSRPGEALTLAKGGVLTAIGDTLVVGQGPRLAGVDPGNGNVRWEVPVATPRGTNEVERLADLIGPAARVGKTLCVRAFQSAVGCVDGERGALIWTKNIGGNDPIAADEQYVFAADASDRMTAWRFANGDVAWSNERFLNRGLSGPLSLGKAVVYGDGEGYVHFLSRDNGQTLLRLPTDGSAIAAKPVLSGTTMLVVTRNGGVYAMRPE
jgi:outer membrane protein assembly factor BamB